MDELRSDPIGISREAISSFLESDGMGLSAEAAYRLVFALPALAIFFGSLSAMAAEYTGVDVFQYLLDRARDAMPADSYQSVSTVLNSIEEQSGFGFLLIGLGIALWSGSSALATLVKAINRAHGLEEARGIVRQRLLGLALTAGLSVMAIAAFVLLVFGQQIGREVASALEYGGVFSMLLGIGLIPVVLVLFLTVVAILYGVGPAERMTLREVYPGAVIATVLWIIVTWGFSLYLSIADPGSIYGAIGGLLVTMLFLYISSITVIVGAQVNAALVRRREGRTPHPPTHVRPQPDYVEYRSNRDDVCALTGPPTGTRLAPGIRAGHRWPPSPLTTF